MKYKSPKVTLLGLALVGLLTTAVLAETPAEPPSAQQLVNQAAQNIARQPSVEAKLRQRVELFGKFLVGYGSYRQLTIDHRDHRQMFRLEMKLQVADRLTSLLVVSNGTTLWIRRDYGDKQNLAYVNLGRIRELALQPAPGSPETGRPETGTPETGRPETGRPENGGREIGPEIGGLPTQWLAMGGLHQLLHGLSASFDFSQPVAAQIGDQPVWQLTGRWKPRMLAQLLPGTPTELAPGDPVGLVDLGKLPQHLPTMVVLALGRDDQFPLFPYRIEYRRLNGAQRPGSAGPARGPASYRAVATMELFEVRHYVVEPRDFDFQPGDQQVEDRTDVFLRRLGLASKPGE